MPGFHRNRTKIVLLFLVTVVFYNEFLSYTLQSCFKWPSLSCNDRSECTKILLVADPQIIGEQFEKGFPIGNLARWDCDRYLSKTFSRAVSHFNPDVVVFLGDIMDEGSIATKEEYSRYSRRFFSIFEASSLIQYMYLPGDNDIGGENDHVSHDKLNRYYQTFTQADSYRIKNVDLYKINRLTFSMPQNISSSENRTQIVLTHLPLLFLPNEFVQKVVKLLRPQVIFSAHDHKSLHTSIDTSAPGEDQFAEMLLPAAGPTWRFQLGASIVHEIMVPTCSYRMGVADVGFGAAVIDDYGSLSYAVFWLPSRFTQLGVYMGMIFVVVFYCFSFVCCCLCSTLRSATKPSKIKYIV